MCALACLNFNGRSPYKPLGSIDTVSRAYPLTRNEGQRKSKNSPCLKCLRSLLINKLKSGDKLTTDYKCAFFVIKLKIDQRCSLKRVSVVGRYSQGPQGYLQGGGIGHAPILLCYFI